MIFDQGKARHFPRGRAVGAAGLRWLLLGAVIGGALLGGSLSTAGFPGVAPARAARLSDVFPDLQVDKGSRTYDYPHAQSAADRLFLTLRTLSGYTCRTRDFYSLRRLPAGAGSDGLHRGESGPRPNESFDLSIRYAPFSVSVHLRHPRRGATVVYRAADGVAEVHPFGFLPLTLSLSPRSSLISSRFGHTVDHADFLSYDRRILRPACLTHSCLLLGTGKFDGRPVSIINVAPDQLEARPVFGRMWLLLDRETSLPASVASEGPDGQFWERIDYQNCLVFLRKSSSPMTR